MFGNPLLAMSAILWALLAIFLLLSLVVLALGAYYGSLWFQAYMSDADIRFKSLVGMSFRQVPARMIVTAKVMARQSGLDIHRDTGITTKQLEAHFLAGGDVILVTRAIIAAHRAGIVLDFDRASAMDLAGRDVLDAVRISVAPQVINCPDEDSVKPALSAVARNGVELRVRARVTVRTNMANLVGGATEKTIVARVGQGIVTSIGSSESHMDVLQTPDRISKQLLKSGLDANTAFEIVSIDIASIAIGENVGARLQSDQAEADVRVAVADAEVRRAGAVAHEQEMLAKVLENQALVVRAEAGIPTAIAGVMGQGEKQFQSRVDIPIGSVLNEVFAGINERSRNFE